AVGARLKTAPTMTRDRRRRSGGFSLVELMVAVAIGLLIVAAMMTAFLSDSTTTRANVRFSEVQNNGRYAIDLLRRELQHSGFLGLGALGLTKITKSGATGT